MNFLDYEIGLPKLWGKVKGIVPEPETDENVSALLTQMVNTDDEALSAEQLASIEEEMIDARKGVNYTYPSVGDAVRGQIKDTFDKVLPTSTASGAIASFDDGSDLLPAKSVKVNIEPVQDLHGYDHPWPAGGGKNKIPFPYLTKSGTTDGITYTIDENGKITATGTTERGTNFHFVRNMTLTAGTYTASVIDDFSGLVFKIYDPVNRVGLCDILPAEHTHHKTFTIENETTINIYLNTGQAGVTVNISAYFQLEEGSTATDYAPYSNICPISGWTGAEVVRAGKNLLPHRTTEQTTNGIVFTPIDGGGYHIQGTATKNAYYAIEGGFESAKIPLPSYLKNGLTYVVSGRTSKCSIPIYLYGQGNFASTFTVDTDKAEYYGAFLFVQQNVTIDEDVYPQLELGSTATAYESYQGITYPISFPSEAGTVYGGTLDVTSGELVVDRAMVDLGALNWSKNVGNWQTFLSSDINNIVKMPSEIGDTNVVCSVYKTVLSSAGDNYVYISLSGQIRIKDTAKQNLTAADFKIAMSGVQLVYELAEPQTYYLTPTEVATLLGTNNIWADTGDTTVTYKSDVQLYIQKLTSPTEDDMVANDNIPANTFFTIGNTLYYSTVAIARGATITPNTNCTVISLADALNQLNS